MGVTPTKEELDDMCARAGENGKIHFNGFKKMISTRATTKQDETQLMAALTYFAEDGKIPIKPLIAALVGFNPTADKDDMDRFKKDAGDPADLQTLYLKLTEV